MKYLNIYCLVFFFHFSTAQVSDFDHINFIKADHLAQLHEGKTINNLPLLTYNLTHKLSTDAEKFRAIYLWVCQNISGDAHQQNLISRNREKFKNDSLGFVAWNNAFKKVAFEKLRKHKKTICTGYAYLIKEMCFMANIECEIIDGYARSFEVNVEALETFNHSWNAIKLNKKWYLCDATWSSGYMINDHTFVKDYNDGYFLTDPILFAKDHYPLKKKWFLNDSLANQKFIPEPIVYGETFKHKIIPISPKNLYETTFKHQDIEFKFKSLRSISIEDISLVKISGELHKPFQIYDIKQENGIISFKCVFKHRGSYDLHLKIKNDIVVSYNIEVKKIKPFD